MMRAAKRKTKMRMVVQTVPTKEGTFEEFAIRITPTQLFVRPLYTREGGRREMVFYWGGLYVRGLMDKLDRERATRKKNRKRGKK